MVFTNMVLINYSFDMVLTNMVIKEIARSLGLTFNLVLNRFQLFWLIVEAVCSVKKICKKDVDLI